MPRHILHLDGDSFFAACEISLNPKLKGKPVVTGQERGIATAMSSEAKVLGVHRGMPVFKIKKEYPQVVIVSSNYRSYGIFAQRMYDIVRRYTPLVEEYSIDECFADLSHLPDPEAAAREMKKVLKRELGITFSMGLAPTKVLAKVASKWNKPDGFTVIRPEDIQGFLKDLEVGRVWGIGPKTSAKLQGMGVRTALDLTNRPLAWIEAHLPKPEVCLWHELRGAEALRVHSEPDPSTLVGVNEQQSSIQQTRTFSPKTKDKKVLLSELSRNVEGACAKARRHNLATKRIYWFLKTQEFRYHRFEIPLSHPTTSPSEIMRLIKETFDAVYRPGIDYRATGLTLAELKPLEALQNDLFGEVLKKEKSGEIFKAVDKLEKRYGTRTIILGSSLGAEKRRGLKASKRQLSIPIMGEVL